MNRRGFLFGGAAFAIVRPSIIMPIKSFITEPVLLPHQQEAYKFLADGTYQVQIAYIVRNAQKLSMLFEIDGRLVREDITQKLSL